MLQATRIVQQGKRCPGWLLPTHKKNLQQWGGRPIAYVYIFRLLLLCATARLDINIQFIYPLFFS